MLEQSLDASEQEVAFASVIGGGAFGTALGLVLARKGAKVKVWVRSTEQAAEVNATRENKKYLPNVSLPENMEWTSTISSAVEGSELVLLAIPTQFLRSFLEANRSTLPVGVPIVVCAKGIEIGTLQTPFQITHDELPGKYAKYMAVISGPSFAKEIADNQPTMLTCAAEDPALNNLVQRKLSCKQANFKVYTSPDIIGCEIAGAVKNVLAIASGASAGCGFGNNTRAALICRGLTEMTRLAQRCISHRHNPTLSCC
jgi:glycerol-3-phosphate dehydrogenase (NAD(P)+)